MERTFVMIKPDGVKRNLIGRIISRFEENNLQIVGLKITCANMELVNKLYPDSLAVNIAEKALRAGVDVKDKDSYGKAVLKWLRTFITSYPIVLIVLESENAIEKVRKIAGYTDPATAKKGTIRGDFGEDSVAIANREGRPVKNLIHASGNKKEAENEINLWFKPEEIINYHSE